MSEGLTQYAWGFLVIYGMRNKQYYIASIIAVIALLLLSIVAAWLE